MAERRMFAKSVINSARFLRMSATARLLYYDLGMAADDDGVVEAFTVMRTTGASEDDLKLLFAKGFITVLNDDYVTFINDWKRNNLIRPDRYHESVYIQLLRDANLVDETDTTGKPSDNQLTTNCHTSGKPDDNQRETEVRLGKDRKGKVSQGKASTGEGKGILTDSCAEPETVSTPPVITILTNTGEEYPIYQNDIDRWSEQFPAVDVLQALRSMQAWSDSHPQKRKTKRGMRAFVTNWLNREQNKGGNKNGSNSSQPDTRSTQEDKYADWDFGLVL